MRGGFTAMGGLEREITVGDERWLGEIEELTDCSDK